AEDPPRRVPAGLPAGLTGPGFPGPGFTGPRLTGRGLTGTDELGQLRLGGLGAAHHGPAGVEVDDGHPIVPGAAEHAGGGRGIGCGGHAPTVLPRSRTTLP